MISFLETFSNVVYVIVVYFTVRTSFTTLSMLTSLYMIILPYAFLINTSENKDRVVEHGWASVFKNVSRKSGETMLSSGSQAMKNNHRKQSKRPYNKENQAIFVTSSSALSKVTYNKVGISQNLSFESEPCSSKGYKDTTKRHHTDITRLDANLLHQQDHQKKNISLELIRNMTEYLNEEDRYIEYFKEFVEYTGNQSDQNARMEFQMNDKLLPNYIPEDTSKDKIDKHKAKGSKKTSEIPKKTRPAKLDQCREETNQLHNKTKFKGKKSDRILIRKELLTQIACCDEQEELYNVLKEELICAEENFI